MTDCLLFLGYVCLLSFSILNLTFKQVMDKLGLSYHNIRSLHQKVDKMPDRAGPWLTRTLPFRDQLEEKYVIRYRDPVEAIKSLWADPSNADHLMFAPKRVFSDASKKTESSVKCGPVNGGIVYRCVIVNFSISLLIVSSLNFHVTQWLLLSLSQQTKHS